MNMRFRVIVAVFLLAAVSTQQSVFAEVSDPTTETWTHPTRISPISGLEEYNGDSELFFYNSAWYIALSSLESTIFTTVDESGYLAQSYVLLENELAPRIVDHNEMMYLSTIRVTEHNWELVLRSTFDGVNWLSETIIHIDSGELPMDYDLDISSQGIVHAVWSVTEGNNRGLTHFVYESVYQSSLAPLDVPSRGAFTSEHSPSVEWRDGCLYVAWISNQFKPPAQHAGIEHEEVVFAIQCEGIFSQIIPMTSTFTVDADPFFVSHADEPMVVFSSLRDYNKEFDSEYSSFSNIWVSNLFDNNILHQLPVWNTDEYNPSGSYGNDKLGVIWHDHTGMFIAFSSLEFDDSNDFIIPSGIATTPNEIEMAISSTGFIDEVVIENIGQVEVFGELRCSENLAIQLSEFRLQPGESVTFWVHFTSELGGKYVEEISVLSTAGDFSIPVNIQYDAEINEENPEIPDAGPVVQTDEEDGGVDFTVLGVIAILAGLMCLFILANKSLHRRTAMGLALMVIVMFVTPLSSSMMAKADLEYEGQEFNSNNNYHMIEYENPPEAGIEFYNEPDEDISETLLTYPGLAVEGTLLSLSSEINFEVFKTNHSSLASYLKSCDKSIAMTVQGLDHNVDGNIETDEIVKQRFECSDYGNLSDMSIYPVIVNQETGVCYSGSGVSLLEGYDQNMNSVLDDEEVLSIEVYCDQPRYSEYYIDPLKFELNLPYPIVNLTFGGLDARGNKDVWLHIYDKNSNQEELLQILEGNDSRRFIETNSWGAGLNLPTSGTLLDTRYGGEFDLMLFSTLTEDSSYIYGDQLLVKAQKAVDRIEITSVDPRLGNIVSENRCNQSFIQTVHTADNSFVGVLRCEANETPRLFENGTTYSFEEATNNFNLYFSDSNETSYWFNYTINNQYPLVKAMNPLASQDIVFINNGDKGYSIEYRDETGDEITREAVSWSNAMDSGGESIRNNVELKLGVRPPIITNVMVNQSDRFFKYDESVPIRMDFYNPYDTALEGEVKITAIDLTTSTLQSAVMCNNTMIPAKSDLTFQFNVKPNAQMSDIKCMYGDTGIPTLYPDHTYFLVADFIPHSSGKSESRFGANATNIMSSEIASSMFTVTYGDVISNVRIIHEDYRLNEYDSDKIYLLNAFDASSTLMMDTALVSQELYKTYKDEYEVEFINSTQEFQEVVQSAEYGATVINLMGDSIPIPRNYLTIPLEDDQYLGNWNIEGFSSSPTSIQDNSRYNNDADIFGNPAYTSRHQYGVSSILFDGDGDYASITDYGAEVVCDSSTSCYLKLGGVGFSTQNAKTFHSYHDAIQHAPLGVFSVQDTLQFHISFLFDEFNTSGKNLIASYGHNASKDSGWKLYVDSNGSLSFELALDSDQYLVLSTVNGVISQDEWYSVYVNLEDNELSLLVNDEHVELRSNQNPYPLSTSNIYYHKTGEEPNKGLLIAGWDNSSKLGELETFTFSNMLVDKLSISNKIVEVNSEREPSQQDYERAQYWLSVLGSYISESNINFVNLGPHPFKFVTNDASDWPQKRLNFNHHGFDSMLNNYSLPATHDADCLPGPLTWSTHLDWEPNQNSNVFALEATSFARKSLISESLLTNGDTDLGCSVVERFPFGDGAITQVNLDFSNPLYIVQSIDGIVDVVNATIDWNPEVVYVLNVRQKTSCEVINITPHDNKEFNLNTDCVERSGIFTEDSTFTSRVVNIHRSNGEVLQDENISFSKLNNIVTGTAEVNLNKGDRIIFDSSGTTANATGMVSLLNIDSNNRNPGGRTQYLEPYVHDSSKEYQDMRLHGGSGTGDVTANITVARNGANVSSLVDIDGWKVNTSNLQFETGDYLLVQNSQADSANHQCRVNLTASEIKTGVVDVITVNSSSSITWNGGNTENIQVYSNGTVTDLYVNVTNMSTNQIASINIQIADGGSGFSVGETVTISDDDGNSITLDIESTTTSGGKVQLMNLITQKCSNDYSYEYGDAISLQTTSGDQTLPPGIENYPINVVMDYGIIIQQVTVINSGDGYVLGDSLHWTPPGLSDISFSFRVDAISNQDNQNLVSMVQNYKAIGQFRFVEVNEIDDFDQLIMSNVENSVLVNYNSQGTLPMPDRYITGAQPQLLSSALFNFELIKIGFLEVTPNLANYPEQHPVELQISYDSGIAERFTMITQPREFSTEEENNYTWMPLKDNLQMTTAILASQINNQSSHLKAVAANNIISLQLRPDVHHTPSNINIVSTNELAITFTEYDLLEPVDTSTHREKGTVSGEGYYWTRGIFDNTGLGLKHGSKFNTTFDASSHLSIDFWMTISSAHSLNHNNANKPVVTLQCLNSQGIASGNISMLEQHFSDLDIGTSYPISLSLSDFDWTDESSSNAPPTYYINRVNTNNETDFDASADECENYRLEISPTQKMRNIVIDHVHAIQDPNIGILNQIDLDVEGYLADFGDFFAHNKNTLALDYRQPFTHISLSMDSPLADIYTDISIQKPLAPIICILDQNSIYVTDNRCDPGSRSIQTIPADHPGAVPVCVNDYGSNGNHTYYAGYENCFGSRTRYQHVDPEPPKMLFTPVNQKMVIYALDSGVSKNNSNYCQNLNATQSEIGHFVCIDGFLNENSSHPNRIIEQELSSSENHLVLPSMNIFLSGLNRLFPDELPPLYDVHEEGIIESSTYDFELRSDLFEFLYDSDYSLPSTMPKIPRELEYGLFSPTDLDWMYSVYQNETDTGSFVGPGMFDIHSGSIVLADTSFTKTNRSMELIAQLLWSSRQNHRLLHVLPDLNGEISIDTDELDTLVSQYRELGYVQITERSFTPNNFDGDNVLRLYDGLDGIYMHGGDDKMLILSDPTSVMMPKLWYSEIKTSDAIGFRANMDLVDNIDKHHSPYVSIPFSEGILPNNHANTGHSDYNFTLKSNSIQDLFVELDSVKGIANPSAPEWYFWNGLNNSSEYNTDNAKIIQDGDKPKFNVTIQWEATNTVDCPETLINSTTEPMVDVFAVQITDIPDNCDGIWSLNMSLDTSMRKSYTRSLLSVDLLKVGKTDSDGSHHDVTSTFSENFESTRTINDELKIDDGIGFEPSSVKIVNVDEGFDPSELGLMFNHWIARNGHCLVLATNHATPNFLFSTVGFMKSNQYAETVVSELLETGQNGTTSNPGFAKFTGENTGGLKIDTIQSTLNSTFTKTTGAFYDNPITESIDHTQRPSGNYSYVKTTSSKHMHKFVGIHEEGSSRGTADVAIRAFVPIQRGGIVFAGDGDLSSAMSFALLYSTQEHAVRQRLGIFTKGETISLSVSVNLSGYPLNQNFESTFMLSGKKKAGSPISEVVLDSQNASLPTGENHSILLSWTIPSSMPIGFVSLRVDAIDTVLDRKTSTWGDDYGESLGFRIESLMYIIDVETPLMVGAFDDADINVIVYNEMSVENLIDVSVYLTHGKSAQPVSFETQQPVNCPATSRCKVRLRWDATSDYAGQTREIGTYQGRAYIDDHVTRYQVVNKDNQNPIQKPAIIDSQVFEIDIQAELEIVLPGESSKWRIKFGDGPWEMYNGGEIIRKFAASSQIQIQPVGVISNSLGLDCYVNNDTSVHNSLTIRYLARSDSPSYLLYHLRTDDQYRDEAGCGANENRKLVVDKFKMDGTTYSIPMDGLEQSTMITISTELLYDMGSIVFGPEEPANFFSDQESVLSSIGNFDNWTNTQYSHKMIKLEDTSLSPLIPAITYFGYYTTLEIFDGAEGWYSFTWPQKVSEVYSAVINISDFTPGFGQVGGNAFTYSFNKDTDANVLPYHGKAVGETAVNFYVPAGKFIVFIGSSEWGAISSLSLTGIQFGKGHAVNLKPKAACPFANFAEDEYKKAFDVAESKGVSCVPWENATHKQSAAPSLPIDDTGATFRNVPQVLLNALTTRAHLPMPGVNADGSKSKFPMDMTEINLDLLKIGWEDEPLQSNLRIYVKIPFVGSIMNGQVNYKAVLEGEVFLSLRFFEKYCLAPPPTSSSSESSSADVDPYCLQEILAVPGALDAMIDDMDNNFIGWWSTFTLQFDFDIGRYIPQFQAFQQYIYPNGYSCEGVECQGPERKVAEANGIEPIFSREMHLYLFFGFEIGLVNNVAACSPIYYGTGMESRPSLLTSYTENLNHALNNYDETLEPTETGERFAAIMTRAQEETGICPPSMNYQIDRQKANPMGVNFQISMAVGVEWVLEIKLTVKEEDKFDVIKDFEQKQSEATAAAAEEDAKAEESLSNANAIRTERTGYCEGMQAKYGTDYNTCKRLWNDKNGPKLDKLNEHKDDHAHHTSMAESHKKNADDNKKNKRKFSGLYDSPFTLNIEFTMKVGVFLGLELDCLTGEKDNPDGPMCTLIIDLEFVFQAEVKLSVTLFKICIFGACWTPKITVTLSITLDKVFYVNMIGFEDDPDGGAGRMMFCDRESDFSKYGKYKFAVHSAINKFSFGKKELVAVNTDKKGLSAGVDAGNLPDEDQDNDGDANNVNKPAPPAPVATYDNSEVALKIMFFTIKAHIPDAGC
tara:strand:- start:1513 stop:14964 length:13452 start_codon:yes stop_codon:yes gene_type:complete